MASLLSSPGAGPSTPSLRNVHLHASLPSHLSTELSLLSTMITRARDQHRAQLFLRRMYEVLRVGKCLLGYVRSETGAASGSGMTSTVDDTDKRRRNGERIVQRLIRALFNAHRFTAQIIELHHFLPLQTTVIAIYARLFALTLNVASALGMDVEKVISGTEDRAGKSKGMGKGKGKGTVQFSDEGRGGIVFGDREGARGMFEDLQRGAFGDMGMEIGEKIERPSITSRHPNTSVPIPISSTPKSPALANGVPLPTTTAGKKPSKIPKPPIDPRAIVPIPSLAYHPDHTNDGPTIEPSVIADRPVPTDTPKPKLKKRALDQVQPSYPDPPTGEGAKAKIASTPSGEQVARSQDGDVAKVKKKKVKSASASTSAERPKDTAEASEPTVVKPKLKKKKKDAMDDIFGF